MGLNWRVTSDSSARLSTGPLPIARLRDDLLAANFTVETLTKLWGEQADAALHRGNRVPALRALGEAESITAAATVATAFVLGIPVTVRDLAAALPNLGVDDAVSLGLVDRREKLASPLLDLRPYSFVDANGGQLVDCERPG